MVRIHVAAIAFLIGADPERNVRVQIALWFRELAPITVAPPLSCAAIARAETETE